MYRMSNTGWEYSEKTQTVIGTKSRILQDKETGEEFPVNQVFKRVLGQKQFWKVYLMDFLQVLGILDSKQVDILVYILENTEPANNTFVGTYARIQKETGISQMTISRVLKKLQDANFLKKIQNGVWQVSEQIMMKGSEHKKQLLINYYREEEKQITAPINEEEPEPELEEDITSEKQECCQICGAEKIEMKRKDGIPFMGCPNWKEHKKGA